MDHSSGLVFRRPQAASYRRSCGLFLLRRSHPKPVSYRLARVEAGEVCLLVCLAIMALNRARSSTNATKRRLPPRPLRRNRPHRRGGHGRSAQIRLARSQACRLCPPRTRGHRAYSPCLLRSSLRTFALSGSCDEMALTPVRVGGLDESHRLKANQQCGRLPCRFDDERTDGPCSCLSASQVIASCNAAQRRTGATTRLHGLWVASGSSVAPDAVTGRDFKMTGHHPR